MAKLKSLPTLLSLSMGLLFGLGILMEIVPRIALRFSSAPAVAVLAMLLVIILWAVGALPLLSTESADPKVSTPWEFVRMFGSAIIFAILEPLFLPGVLAYILFRKRRQIEALDKALAASQPPKPERSDPLALIGDTFFRHPVT